MTHVPVCGDVEMGSVAVLCECGQYRQADRPHAYQRNKPRPRPEHDRLCGCEDCRDLRF
jgi:hypothetical protein